MKSVGVRALWLGLRGDKPLGCGYFASTYQSACATGAVLLTLVACRGPSADRHARCSRGSGGPAVSDTHRGCYASATLRASQRAFFVLIEKRPRVWSSFFSQFLLGVSGVLPGFQPPHTLQGADPAIMRISGSGSSRHGATRPQMTALSARFARRPISCRSRRWSTKRAGRCAKGSGRATRWRRGVLLRSTAARS